jgi:hypothetical protein
MARVGAVPADSPQIDQTFREAELKTKVAGRRRQMQHRARY